MTSPPHYGWSSEHQGMQSQCFSSLWFCGSEPTTTVDGVSIYRRLADAEKNGMKETEEWLAAEMNKLSVEERSKALDDIHCVGEDLKETPEIIEESLKAFDEMVKTSTNRIYKLAMNQNRSYVEDSALRLKFLRVNMHNVAKSVQHMMNFLEQKALYFGAEKVAYDILPGDMDREDVELMQSGLLQILRKRDPSGRVIVYRGRIPAECRIKTMNRILYHIFFNMMDSIPSVQTKGVVFVYYDDWKGDGVLKRPGFNFRMAGLKFFHALPVRLSSIHLCMHSSPGTLIQHNQIAQFSLKIVSESIRARIRFHYGSDMERQYQLQTFGIPLDSFPVDGRGKIRIEMRKWCDEYLGNATSDTEQQASHATSPSPIKFVDRIWETDVLFGRGRLAQRHPGNMRYREFLERHIEEYDSIRRSDRRDACIVYAQQLLTSGMRFLKHQRETELWVVCEFNEVVDKIAQFYRTCRRRMKQEAEKR